MTKEQIEQVLHSALTGRIGCHAFRKTYIVPVSYVYEGAAIYAHSADGLKIRMMRKNPAVCFQVDHIDNLANWRSVLVWGVYEELKAVEDQVRVLNLLQDRFGMLTTGESVKPHNPAENLQKIEKNKRPVIYRIRIEEMTGRFEKH
jgi:nitroimidazol reductase NimA-like FMN-containing flavoprotein (pyridoxamine 5'-phosphate oxidase superfamily)